MINSNNVTFFTGNSCFYANYRKGYPPELFYELITQFSLTSESEILDLGCGTGFVSIPLALRGYKINAVDPDYEMMTEGKRLEIENKIPILIRWIVGSDKTLTRLNLPRLKLCTMGRSFHWMDRNQTLKTLDDMIEPEGGVACLDRKDAFHSTSVHLWGRAAISEIKEMFGDSWDYSGRFESKDSIKHEEIFARLLFKVIKIFKFDVSEEHTTDDLIGQILSYSYIHPVLLNEPQP